MILITVLGAIGILYIMIVQMSADAIFTAQYYNQVLFKEKSYYISRSALGGVMQIFRLDDEEYDSLQDDWAQEIPPLHMEEDQVYISFRIEDMERRFNVNSILADGNTVDEKHLKQFRRLLEVMELEPDLSNAVLDWMDTDHERRMPLGADGLDYTDYPVKGAKFDSLDEIKLVTGITKEIWLGRVASDRSVPGLKDMLTVFSENKINVNTAPREVLMSLDDEISNDTAAEIIKRREDTPFKSMDDLLEIPGINHDLLFRMKQLSDVKSKYYKIIITVEDYSKQSENLTVIVKRTGQSGKVVFWQAD